MGHFRSLDFCVIGQGAPRFLEEERGATAWGLGPGAVVAM